MKITTELEKEDFDAMHDVVLDVLDLSPTAEQIQKVWDLLPIHEKGVAIQWGASDTVFRDNLYVWLLKNKESILSNIN